MPPKSTRQTGRRINPKHRPPTHIPDTQRELLLARLVKLNEKAKSNQGYKTALRLLEKRYDLASPNAKAEIIKAASFVIWILERLAT